MFKKNIKRPFIAVKRIRVICPQSQLYAAWCAGCGAETEMVTFAEAAKITCDDIDLVIAQVAGGNVHLGIRPEAMLICLDSLLRVNSFFTKRA
jgi:ribosomal protein S27E